MNEVDLAGRYAPGEDVGPLLRSGGAGLIGAGLALAIDRVVPTAATGSLCWPAIVAGATTGEPSRWQAGLTVFALVWVLSAVVFVYGQFRRFVPGPPAAAGVAWAAGSWCVLGPLLLPYAVGWLAAEPSASASGLLAAAALVVGETTAGVLLGGIVLGALNPPRADDSPRP